MACSREQARLNAQKSTGPRTARGKAIASRNAKKHGLASRKAPLLASEDAAGFRQLFQGLLDRYQPADPVGQHLVEKIAMAIHRQRRLWSAEVASDSPPEPSGVERELLAQRERWQFLRDRLTLFTPNAPSPRSRHYSEDWIAFCENTIGIIEPQLKKLDRPKTDCDRANPYDYSGGRDVIARHNNSDHPYYELLHLKRVLALELDAAHEVAVEIEAKTRFTEFTSPIVEAVRKQMDTVPPSLAEAASPRIPAPYKPSPGAIATVETTIEKCREQIAVELESLEESVARAREKSTAKSDAAALAKIIERGDLVARYERHLSRELKEAIEQLEAMSSSC